MCVGFFIIVCSLFRFVILYIMCVCLFVGLFDFCSILSVFLCRVIFFSARVVFSSFVLSILFIVWFYCSGLIVCMFVLIVCLNIVFVRLNWFNFRVLLMFTFANSYDSAGNERLKLICSNFLFMFWFIIILVLNEFDE